MYADYLVHFNKNHDPKSGRFTFGDGNGDGVSPDNYRTPELDKKYSELEKTGIFELYHNKPWLKPEDNAEEKWGKDVVKAVDVGIKAFGAEKMWGSEDIDKNSLRSWFLLEDQAIGFPEISYLLVKGWSGDKVFNALRDADKMWDKDNAFRDAYTGYPNNKNWKKLFDEAVNKEPYKDIYTLMEVSQYITDESDTIDTYITECEEILKEMEHSNMDYFGYLMHFNPRHDPKTGRFDFAIGGDRKERYEGKSRSDFKKSMSEEYQRQGYSKGKSRRLAGSAADANRQAVKLYNTNYKLNKKYAEKAKEALVRNDEKNYDKYVSKMNKTYETAKINEYIINNGASFGKALYDVQVAQLLGGIAASTAVANKDGGFNSLYAKAKNFVQNEMYDKIYNSMSTEDKLLYDIEQESVTDIRATPKERKT